MRRREGATIHSLVEDSDVWLVHIVIVRVGGVKPIESAEKVNRKPRSKVVKVLFADVRQEIDPVTLFLDTIYTLRLSFHL